METRTQPWKKRANWPQNKTKRSAGTKASIVPLYRDLHTATNTYRNLLMTFINSQQCQQSADVLSFCHKTGDNKKTPPWCQQAQQNLKRNRKPKHPKKKKEHKREKGRRQQTEKPKEKVGKKTTRRKQNFGSK
jgi:hypothetical protein